MSLATTINTQIKLLRIQTKPFEGQKPGTSGLRKQTKIFSQDHYVENFIQSYFLSFRRDELAVKNVLLVSGDGRFYNTQAIYKIIKLACANGISEVHIAQGGLMSTPACSAYIRDINNTIGNCLGGILLTASHNAGGIDNDFGIKFNVKNGGPAPEEVTNSVYNFSTKLTHYQTTEYNFNETIDINKIGTYQFTNIIRPLKKQFVVKVFNGVQGYVTLMKQQFDFVKIKKLFSRKDFSFCFDAMHGIAGPYATAVFRDEFGASPENLHNCDTLPDFGGLHPDPNLIYAKNLVKVMGLDSSHQPASIPDFGAACDGDADRNMILGKAFFVTPSDSVAILAANSSSFLKQKVKGVARSMPTSGALDNVAKKLGIKLYQTPTGWKFFGNLMDSQYISLCGQQSFGTGSSHIRQKDGIWTILAWLSIIADRNAETQEGKLIGVESVVRQFWKQYGRNYYSRYDYESIQNVGATNCWNHLLSEVQKNKQEKQFKADIYSYLDPVDGSQSKNQGLRFLFSDGSRVIFRQSGTGSVGMTIRIYFEKYQPTNIDLKTEDALKQLVNFGLNLSKIKQLTNRDQPNVIT